MKQEKRRFAAAVKDLRSGDLLLYRAGWRPWHWLHRGTVYSRRAAMLARGHDWPGQWQVLETRFGGGKVSLLPAEVDRWPGRIDVFQANPSKRFPMFSRNDAVAMMRDFARKRYSRSRLFRWAYLCLPIFWRLVKARDDPWFWWPAPGSSTIAVAYGNGGVDPVPLIGDRRASPADLARSSFFKYRFTLVP